MLDSIEITTWQSSSEQRSVSDLLGRLMALKHLNRSQAWRDRTSAAWLCGLLSFLFGTSAVGVKLSAPRGPYDAASSYPGREKCAMECSWEKSRQQAEVHIGQERLI